MCCTQQVGLRLLFLPTVTVLRSCDRESPFAYIFCVMASLLLFSLLATSERTGGGKRERDRRRECVQDLGHVLISFPNQCGVCGVCGISGISGGCGFCALFVLIFSVPACNNYAESAVYSV